MDALQAPDLAQIWGFFFLLLGPIKIIAPFVRLTEERDDAFRRRLAVRAFLFSTAIVLLAATIGVRALRTYDIPPTVLALTGGLILFLVALQGLMEQFTLRPRPPAAPVSLASAATPLAFPLIVTPSGVAAVIIYMTLAADLVAKGLIVLLLLAVMLLDLLAMLFARGVLRYLGMPLMVLGTVLSVVQVALGLKIILVMLDRLGIVSLAHG
jgi:multiple antibiotic resistance protein